MPKFLFVTDSHVKGVSPKSRKDDFFGAVLEKLEEVGEIAEREGVNAVLFGGDLFDRPDPSPSVVSAVCSILARYPVPILAVAGNHDIYGYSPDTISRSMIGILFSAGILFPLEMMADHNSIWGSKDADGKDFYVEVTGCHSHYDLDKSGRDPLLDYSPRPRVDNDRTVCIHLVHGFLSKVERLESIPHTMISDIYGTKANVLLAGHEHTGFGVVHHGRTIFCNPGALGRVSAAVGEINRTVQVALVDVRGVNDYDVSLLPVACARPADEVLDREGIEEEKRQQEQMAAFLSDITGFDVQTTNPFEVMRAIADKENEGAETIPPKVLEEAQNRLRAAMITAGKAGGQ